MRENLNTHMRLTLFLLLTALGSLAIPAAGSGDNTEEPLRLEPVGHVEKSAGHEISGLVKSRFHQKVFWAINDSGYPAAIVPLSPDGAVVSASGHMIRVPGARNIDWESLAIDRSGKLYICDVGNNFSRRKELQIYVVQEPSPNSSSTLSPEVLKVRYPDQKKTSPAKLIHDCEAAFIYNEKLYLLTKRLSDAATALYRLDSRKSTAVNTLTFVTAYPIGGYVTAADVSPDQKLLAVLTYQSLWILYDFRNDDFFNGRKKKIPLKGTGQVESLAFTSARDLMLINETNNEIFSIKLDI